MKLKIHLQKLENLIIFQILEQGIGYSSGYQTVEESIIISDIVDHSVNVRFLNVLRPQIDLSYIRHSIGFVADRDPQTVVNEIPTNINIFLRGKNKDKDLDVISIPFKDNEIRDKVYEILKISFKKLSEILKCTI